MAAASIVTTQPVGTYHGEGKHAHVRAHTHVLVHVHVGMHARARAHAHAYTHTHARASAHVCMSMGVCWHPRHMLDLVDVYLYHAHREPFAGAGFGHDRRRRLDHPKHGCVCVSERVGSACLAAWV